MRGRSQTLARFLDTLLYLVLDMYLSHKNARFIVICIVCVRNNRIKTHQIIKRCTLND